MSDINFDKNNSCLLTIDFQNDFVLPDGSAYIPGSEDVIENIASIVSVYRLKNRPIIHVIRIYQPDGSNAELCRKGIIKKSGGIVSPNTRGINIVQNIIGEKAINLDIDLLLNRQFQEVNNNEWIMYKPRWGAFYNTDLESFLRSKGINSILISGCNYPNCPRATIYEASERDFRIGIIPDSISRICTRGIEELKSIGVSVLTSNDL